MLTCEESIDISYLQCEDARGLSQMMACTEVGEVRSKLEMGVSECMMRQLCGIEEGERSARTLKSLLTIVESDGLGPVEPSANG